MPDEQRETITDQQIQTIAHTIVHGICREPPAFDQEQIILLMKALLRRVVGEQITAIENLGGLGGWARTSLSKLLSDAAEIEAVQVFGMLSRAFATVLEMKMRAGAMAEHAGIKRAASSGDAPSSLPRHLAYIEADFESWRRGGSCRAAVCLCGWRGPQRATLELAADDALVHERSDMHVS